MRFEIMGGIGLALLVVLTCSGTALAAELSSAKVGEIYQAYCSVCHGENGDGKSRAAANLVPPPRDFSAPQVAANLTRESMIRSISEGRPGTAMVAWKHQLNDGQIEALADYIRTRFMLPSAYDTSHEGRRIYAEYCSVCHGDKGNGDSRASSSFDPPPRNFTTDAARRELSRERMIFSVTYGRADTAMAGWGTQLKREQVEAVVDYIRESFMRLEDGDTKSHSPKMAMNDGRAGGGHQHQHMVPGADTAAYFAQPYPQRLVGDKSRGHELFMANCVPCHGEKGDGNGPRAFFILPRPRNFNHPAARASLNRPHLFEAIAKGTRGSEMPAWEKVLNPQQIADIGEFVFTAFIRPGSAPKQIEAANHPHTDSAAPHRH